jgi:hypothetical protein
MDGLRKRSGPATTGPPRTALAPSTTTSILPDRQRQARERVRAIDRRRRIATMADELMPMAVWYGPRPLRPIPLGRFLVKGWWA